MPFGWLAAGRESVSNGSPSFDFQRGRAAYARAGSVADARWPTVGQFEDRIQAAIDPRRLTGRAADPDRFHPQAFGGLQVGQRVVDQHATIGDQPLAVQQQPKTADCRFGLIGDAFDRVQGVEMANDAGQFEYRTAVMPGSVRENDFSSRQAP